MFDVIKGTWWLIFCLGEIRSTSSGFFTDNYETWKTIFCDSRSRSFVQTLQSYSWDAKTTSDSFTRTKSISTIARKEALLWGKYLFPPLPVFLSLSLCLYLSLIFILICVLFLSIVSFLSHSRSFPYSCLLSATFFLTRQVHIFQSSLSFSLSIFLPIYLSF